MSSAKATEQSIRERDFSFVETRKQESGELDIYRAADGVEIRMPYDETGMPGPIRLCAPGLHLDRIVVTDEAGELLDQEAFEVLCFELLDDQAQITFRMTGLEEEVDQETPTPA